MIGGESENADSILVRLEGGAATADNDELKDDLDLSDLDEPTKATSKPKAIPKQEIAHEKTKESRGKIILKYSKMAILVVVLIISIIFLASKKIRLQKTRLIAIEPGVPKTVKVFQSDLVQNQIGILLKGPFLVQENIRDVKPSNEKVEVLQVHITGENSNGDLQTLSSEWKVRLIKPSLFDTTLHETKKHVFLLTNKEKGSTVFINFAMKNVDVDLGVLLVIDETPIDPNKGIICGSIVLLFLYAMIVTEIIDRTFASLVAATLSMGFLALFDSRPDELDIVSWVDIETLTLLVGMMILVAILAESGIFDYFAVFAYKIAQGRVWPLINCLCFFTASLAAFLDSVTMMLLATPVTIRLCEVLSINPVPVLICMVIFANVGAAITPVGDPPNVIISLNPFIAQKGVNFATFVLHMLPGVILALIQCYIHVRLLYRKPQSLHFKDSDELEELRHEIAVWERTLAGISPYSQDEDIARQTIGEKIDALKLKLEEAEAKGPAKTTALSFEETLAQLTAQYPLRDKILLIKAGVAFIFVMILFCGHSIPGMSHISLGWSALIGAMLLIIIADKRDMESILAKIEWSTLLFFAALFVVMESLSEMGLIEIIGKFVVKMIVSVAPDYRLMLAIVIVLWVSAVASAFLDNIPVTTMMVKIIITLSEDEILQLPLHPLVWALAFGACFGGNGTLIGASANVVTAGVAEQHGYRITFINFFVVCFPLMLGSILVAMIYLLIAHVVFSWHN